MADAFNWSMLSNEDFEQAMTLLDQKMREPDLIIAPDGNSYLYRWHLQRNFRPDGVGCGSNLHIQVASDPERPLHNHPWDNMSVILGGAGYLEHIQKRPPHGDTLVYQRRKGDVIFRKAGEAHRLIMPDHGVYTMTQFTFGPKINTWGFYYEDGFRPHWDVTRLEGNKSIHVRDSDAMREQVEDALNDSKGG